MNHSNAVKLMKRKARLDPDNVYFVVYDPDWPNDRNGYHVADEIDLDTFYQGIPGYDILDSCP